MPVKNTTLPALIVALLVGPPAGMIAGGALCSLLFGNDMFYDYIPQLVLLAVILGIVAGIPLGIAATRKKLNLVGTCALGGGLIGVIVGSLYDPSSMYVVSLGLVSGLFCGGLTVAIYKRSKAFFYKTSHEIRN